MTADVTIDPVEQLAARFARLTEEAAREATTSRGSFAIAIPGGSAAESLLPSLIPASIDWSKCSVFWVDERMVPPDHAESNFRAAKGAWLDQVAVPAERIHRMHGEDPVPVQAAANYARLLRAELGDPVTLDLVLLGMGPDGHVASLFPGHRLLRAWDREVAVLDDSPKPPRGRMTLTLKVLTAARHTVVFAAGGSKAEAIADVLSNDDSELPIALATMGSGSVTFLLDPEAASKWTR
jgi:6-phosphogluconolactonase